MRIVSLEVENYKKLKAVYIEPKGNLIEITGQNGAGKTSTLDAIWAAIAGEKVIQTKPIRKGAAKAKIRLDLGELIVTRTFKAKDDDYTTSITVEAADGAQYKGPQGILNALFGALSFDPLAVTRMKPEEQFKAFRKFVPEIDFDQIDALNKADYAKRTEKNRIAKDRRAQAEGLGVPAKTLTTPVDVDALTAQLREAGEKNAAIEREKAVRAQKSQEARTLRERATGHRENAEALRRQAEAADKLAAELETKAGAVDAEVAAFPALNGPIDTGDLTQRITAAREQNSQFEKVQLYDRYITEAEAAERESEELTKRIDLRKEQVAEEVASADMPVEGLSFEDGIVHLNGVPFDQASQAEKLRTSVAIAAAMNPKLRMALVHDGSLLDQKSWAILTDLAEQYDFQIFVETVASGRPGAVVLEDGMIKQPALEAAE